MFFRLDTMPFTISKNFNASRLLDKFQINTKINISEIKNGHIAFFSNQVGVNAIKICHLIVALFHIPEQMEINVAATKKKILRILKTNNASNWVFLKRNLASYEAKQF